jgi:hypothetical protein
MSQSWILSASAQFSSARFAATHTMNSALYHCGFADNCLDTRPVDGQGAIFAETDLPASRPILIFHLHGRRLVQAPANPGSFRAPELSSSTIPRP